MLTKQTAVKQHKKNNSKKREQDIYKNLSI